MSSKPKKHIENMVWIDLEMTGLDPNKERIIEIATIITDGDLNIVAEGPNIAINQPAKILNGMDDWNKREHKKSGLIDRVKESKVKLSAAEEETLKFIKKYTFKNKAPLCGNSVHHDRRFLIRYMPNLIEHLHYRIVDVSSISSLVARWYPASQVKKLPKKKKLHQALEDIRESIEELAYIKTHFFK